MILTIPKTHITCPCNGMFLSVLYRTFITIRYDRPSIQIRIIKSIICPRSGLHRSLLHSFFSRFIDCELFFRNKLCRVVECNYISACIENLVVIRTHAVKDCSICFNICSLHNLRIRISYILTKRKFGNNRIVI